MINILVHCLESKDSIMKKVKKVKFKCTILETTRKTIITNNKSIIFLYNENVHYIFDYQETIESSSIKYYFIIYF